MPQTHEYIAQQPADCGEVHNIDRYRVFFIGNSFFGYNYACAKQGWNGILFNGNKALFNKGISMEEVNELIEQRKKKLKELRELGVEPYGGVFYADDHAGDLLKKYESMANP